MNNFFKELFGYNHHMNQKLVAALVQQAPNIPVKSRELMSHTLNAHHTWNNRIEKTALLYTVWQIHEPEAWILIDKANTEKTLHILDGVDLDQVITYRTSKGDPFENTVRDVLFHVINHSTYHRGQIVSDMKQHGLEPISSDYIFYKR